MPRRWCRATSAALSAWIDGFVALSPHDHVLRNQSVGSTSIVAGSGPALRTVIWMSEILGRRLGVVDGDLPVAPVVEDAGVDELELGVALPRARFSATSRSYGNSACGYM